MTTKPLRWGLLGTARINRSIIPPLRSSLRNDVVGVASRSLERATAYGREWGIPRVFGSYNDMLGDPDIDVIYNPLPNTLHTAWTIRAVEAGKHVLCEKPLAVTVEDVDAIAAAAERTERVVTEGFMYRHHPQTLEIARLVGAGAIGDLRVIRGSFTFTLTAEGHTRLDPALGGGCLWDVGCYPISYARTIVGAEPLEVFGWQQTASSGVDDTFAGLLRFADDVVCAFDAGFRSPFRTEIEIVGTTGTIKIPTPFKPGLEASFQLTRDGNAQTIAVDGQELYLGEVEDIADAVLNGIPPRVSLADSRANIATIAALLQSARLGVPVRLPSPAGRVG
jgi:xylose dehydrogenase (NAD/NADP)